MKALTMGLYNDEIEGLVDLFEEMYTARCEMLPPEIDFNREVASAFIRRMAKEEALFMVHEGSYILGAIMGELFQYSYCDKIYAQEHVFYVRPKHRGEGVANFLLNSFLAWAHHKGAVEVHAGWAYKVNRGEQLGLAMLYRGKGFIEQGKFYILKVT